ncbi:MAG: site-specific integrase, partial [Synergistaceae bacterium]
MLFLESRGRSKNTVTNYRVDLEQFREYLLRQGISDVSGIDSQSVRVYLSNIIGFGIAKSSAARKLSAVRGFIRW